MEAHILSDRRSTAFETTPTEEVSVRQEEALQSICLTQGTVNKAQGTTKAGIESNERIQGCTQLNHN